MCLTAGGSRVQICTHPSSIMITVYFIRHSMALRSVLLTKILISAKYTSQPAFWDCGGILGTVVCKGGMTFAHGSGGSSSYCGLSIYETAHCGKNACEMVSISCQQDVESGSWASGHPYGGLSTLTEMGTLNHCGCWDPGLGGCSVKKGNWATASIHCTLLFLLLRFYVWVFDCMCEYTLYACLVPGEVRRRRWIPWKWSCGQL